jgi:ABC-2 type transport system ATP-binding protein
MIAIEAIGLSRRFGDVLAVDGLDLRVEAGTVFGFLGHNGAGKTTTVRLLNGVLAPSEGSARVLGLSPAEQGAELRARTGVLTETPSLEERLTGRENLWLYADLYGVEPDAVEGRVSAMLETFGLAERADDKVGGYSKGMHQRLALARALCHEPEMLFLDEPTAGLDPVATRQLHGLIAEMTQEQRTVFLCTHNLDEASRLCDQVAVLERGRIVAQGPPRELARQLGNSNRVEIEVALDDTPAALRLLNALPGVDAVDGGHGSLSARGLGRESIPDTVRALANAGVDVYRVIPQEPTLEDVYFSLHDRYEVAE